MENKTLIFYKTKRGRIPFQKWLSGVRDIHAQARIQARLDRLAMCHYGDCKSLRGGLYELKIDYGPGYRIYFAELKSSKGLLLLGGTKRTQKKDIGKATKYWQEFKLNYEV